MRNMYDSLVAREVDSAEKWHTILKEVPRNLPISPLQTWAWGSIKARWGWSMHPTVWETKGEPHAAALILKRNIPRSPFCILYVPKGPALDYANRQLRHALLIRLQQIARNDRAIFIKIDPDVRVATGADELQHDAVGDVWRSELELAGWQFSDDQIQFRNTVLIDLTRSEEDLLAAMKSKTRYNIRLAGRKGVTVRVGTPADFELIAQMYTETSERNAFGIRPKSYYLDVWRTFYTANMLYPLIAEYDGQALAAVMLVHYDELALYMYGASTNHERQRMPTYLLQWEAIRWAKAQGCTIYDMWGAPDKFDENDRLWGVWKFKRGFNGTVAHHLGAWDFPAYPLLYKGYTEAVPRYLAWLKR